MDKIHLLQKKLKDERGKKVIFLSHCLLNENTRYLGGASRKASVNEIIDDLQKKGMGIIQMRCPEQKTWGGVLKREMLMAYYIKGSLVNAFCAPYLIYFRWKTKRSFKIMAKEVVSEIKDYIDSWFEVMGIIGIKGSPSCGVSASLDLKKSADFVAQLNIEKIDKDAVNDYLFKNCMVDKSGLFFNELKQGILANNIKIKFYEHDLLMELKGKISNINFT